MKITKKIEKEITYSFAKRNTFIEIKRRANTDKAGLVIFKRSGGIIFVI